MSIVIANLLLKEILYEETIPEEETFKDLDLELEKRFMIDKTLIGFTNPNEDGTKTRYVAIRADI